MRTKTPIQLMYEHERYANSFTKVSAASAVVYMKSNKLHTYSAKTSLIRQHLERTLAKIKAIHRREFEEEFNKRYKLINGLLKDENNPMRQDSGFCPAVKYSSPELIQYELHDTRTRKTLAYDSIWVPSTTDRRMVDAIYRSLESKGINRKYWFRFKPLPEGGESFVHLTSTQGVTLTITNSMFPLQPLTVNTK